LRIRPTLPFRADDGSATRLLAVGLREGLSGEGGERLPHLQFTLADAAATVRAEFAAAVTSAIAAADGTSVLAAIRAADALVAEGEAGRAAAPAPSTSKPGDADVTGAAAASQLLLPPPVYTGGSTVPAVARDDEVLTVAATQTRAAALASLSVAADMARPTPAAPLAALQAGVARFSAAILSDPDAFSHDRVHANTAGRTRLLSTSDVGLGLQLHGPWMKPPAVDVQTAFNYAAQSSRLPTSPEQALAVGTMLQLQPDLNSGGLVDTRLVPAASGDKHVRMAPDSCFGIRLPVATPVVALQVHWLGADPASITVEFTPDDIALFDPAGVDGAMLAPAGAAAGAATDSKGDEGPPDSPLPPATAMRVGDAGRQSLFSEMRSVLAARTDRRGMVARAVSVGGGAVESKQDDPVVAASWGDGASVAVARGGALASVRDRIATWSAPATKQEQPTRTVELGSGHRVTWHHLTTQPLTGDFSGASVRPPTTILLPFSPLTHAALPVRGLRVWLHGKSATAGSRTFVSLAAVRVLVPYVWRRDDASRMQTYLPVPTTTIAAFPPITPNDDAAAFASLRAAASVQQWLLDAASVAAASPSGHGVADAALAAAHGVAERVGALPLWLREAETLLGIAPGPLPVGDALTTWAKGKTPLCRPTPGTPLIPPLPACLCRDAGARDPEGGPAAVQQRRQGWRIGGSCCDGGG